MCYVERFYDGFINNHLKIRHKKWRVRMYAAKDV